MAEIVTDLTVEVIIKGRIVGDNGAMQIIDKHYVQRFSDGSGSSQVATVLFEDSKTTSSTSTDLDLGTALDFQGAAAAMTKTKVILVENKSTTADLVIKPGSTNAITTLLGGTNPTLTIGPSSVFLALNPDAGGWATTASADTIAIETTASSQEYAYLFAGGIG